MALKLPRTIRLDPSDGFVYARAAEPGEWAVSGAFLFWEVDPETLAGKERQAFRGGFLGVASFGWSTLVTVAEASAAERAEAVQALCAQLVAHLGAPDLDAARAAAEEEVAFAASLCDHPAGTLLGVNRSVEEGGVRERFRTLHRRETRLDPIRAFHLIEETGDGDEPGEEVDLAALMKEPPR